MNVLELEQEIVDICHEHAKSMAVAVTAAKVAQEAMACEEEKFVSFGLASEEAHVSPVAH